MMGEPQNIRCFGSENKSNKNDSLVIPFFEDDPEVNPANALDSCLRVIRYFLV